MAGNFPGNQCMNTLGTAYPAAWFDGTHIKNQLSDYGASRDTSDTATNPYRYPSALVKQFTTDLKAEQFPTKDISMTFNADFDWYFKSMGSDPPTSTQYDLTVVAIHEILHGLGFYTGWNGANQVSYINDPNTSKYLLPWFTAEGITSITFKIWNLQTIFDSFLTANGSPMKGLAVKVSGYQKKSAMKEWADAVSSSNEIQFAKAAFKAATTSKSIKFQAGVAGFTLYTENNVLLPSSSISHFDRIGLSETQDYLMRPDAKDLMGQSLSMLESSHASWKFGIVGPNTCQILQALGYLLVDDAVVKAAATVNDVDMGKFTSASAQLYFEGIMTSGSLKIVESARALALILSSVLACSFVL